MTAPLQRELWLSATLHIVLAATVFVRAALMPTETIHIRNAIQVDVVGLPDKITEPAPVDTSKPVASTPPPSPPTNPEPKIQPAPPSAKALPAPKATKTPARKNSKDNARSQQKALNQIQAMQALESVTKEVQGSRPAIKGAQVATGNSLTGLARIDYDRYFGQIEVAVKAHWRVPQWLADANLSGQIQVLIDERGFVIGKKIVRSSGDEIFDAQMMASVQDSSPLPPPPERLRDMLATSGIVFRFPQ